MEPELEAPEEAAVARLELPATDGWVPGALASLPYSTIPSGLAWSPSGAALAVASDEPPSACSGQTPATVRSASRGS